MWEGFPGLPGVLSETPSPPPPSSSRPPQPLQARMPLGPRRADLRGPEPPAPASLGGLAGDQPTFFPGAAANPGRHPGTRAGGVRVDTGDTNAAVWTATGSGRCPSRSPRHGVPECPLCPFSVRTHCPRPLCSCARSNRSALPSRWSDRRSGSAAASPGPGSAAHTGRLVRGGRSSRSLASSPVTRLIKKVHLSHASQVHSAPRPPRRPRPHVVHRDAHTVSSLSRRVSAWRALYPRTQGFLVFMQKPELERGLSPRRNSVSSH